jgi:hypothetical protein
MPATKMMGYEAKLYYGAAGSTASTLITNSRDLKYDTNPVSGDTTVRGSGSTPPIRTGRTVALEVALTWTMVLNTADATLTALIAAARTGAPVALRVIPATGGTGLDADCIISVSAGAPLGGEQTVDFALVSLNDDSRAPLLNS